MRMNKILNIVLTTVVFILIGHTSPAQHTFSILAIDPATGEIASAGATCGDSIIWQGIPGAIIISDIIPGKGAIHTQAHYNTTNKENARKRMLEGDRPDQIIKWLQANDVSNNPSIRQYGIIWTKNDKIETTAFTGEKCMDHKSHIIGPTYTIQGNILAGQFVLDSIENAFNRSSGWFGERVMQSLKAAQIIGADTRCKSEGTSSLSAFIRLAGPEDASDRLTLDLNVAATPKGVDPIDVLWDQFQQWSSQSLDTSQSK